jgi:hypothetical protein
MTDIRKVIVDDSRVVRQAHVKQPRQLYAALANIGTKNKSSHLNLSQTAQDLALNILAVGMASAQVILPLPVLPEGWTGEKDFRAFSSLSTATNRNIEPVGPHFLAHARRVSQSIATKRIVSN